MPDVDGCVMLMAGETGTENAEPTGDSRLIEMPGHLIRRLQQISFALFLDQAKAFDVTPVQYAALVAIKRSSGHRPDHVVQYHRL